MGEFEVHFSAELLELRKYLDLQFATLAQLLTEVLKRGHIPSVTVPIPPTPSLERSNEDDVPAAHQRESVSLSEKSRLSVAVSSGFGSEQSQQTPPGLQGMPRQTSPGMPRHLSPMKRQISPGMPRVQVTNSRNTTVSMRSRRKTFVRNEMYKRHQIARRAANKSVLFGAVSDEEMPTGWDRLKAVVLSPCANYFIMSLIILNAALLGIEIDMSAKVAQSEVPTLFGTVNEIIVLIFVIEIFLKLLALGCKEFWRGGDAVWNTFDVIIVSISVVEVVLDWLAQSMAAQQKGFNAVRILRTIRVARIFRGVRITRLFRYFSALRALILSIMATWGSLMWTMLLLLLLFYVFSVCFTQLVTDHCRLTTIKEKDDPNAVPVCGEGLEYWTDVIASMHTLFLAITGGIEWGVVYRPLRDISPVGVLLMNLYIIIGFFTVLNVVTGVFVNQAIEAASADKDIATLKQTQQRIAHMEQLTDVFNEVEGQDGLLSISVLEQALEESKLGAFMESLGISTDDVWTLFMLIDVDDSGMVDLEEFVSGCMHLRGPAKSLQVAKMSYENKLTRQYIKQLLELVHEMKAIFDGDAACGGGKNQSEKKSRLISMAM